MFGNGGNMFYAAIEDRSRDHRRDDHPGAVTVEDAQAMPGGRATLPTSRNGNGPRFRKPPCREIQISRNSQY